MGAAPNRGMSRTASSFFALALVSALAATACNKEPPAGTGQGTQTSAQQPIPSPQGASTTSTSTTMSAAGSPLADPSAHAEVGKPAPDFTLKDLDGKDVQLGSFKGKVVVLEWFSAACPFVKKSHALGSLKGAAEKHARNGVVWLAVNSSAPGKQGHSAEANREAAKTFGMEYPILLDKSGKVGKAYGATSTPHMYVIDANGTLVYRGAIDNSPDGEGASPTDGKLVSYVHEALAAVLAGKAPEKTETQPYGCGVKYAE